MFGIRRGSAILRAAEGGDGGTGGGAGGGGGKGAEGAAVPAFTDEQQTFLGQLVNSAVTSQLKRSLPGALTESIKAVSWGEIIAPEIQKAIPKPVEPDGGDDKGKGKGQNSALEQQLRDLNAKLEQSEASRIASERARVETEQRRLLDGATVAFRNALQPKLRTELLDVAVGHFGRDMKLAEDGSPLLRVKRAQFKGGPELDEDVPLAEAIPHLLSSESIKPFLPAPSGGGADKKGGNPGHGGGGGNGAPSIDSKDPAERVAARLASLGLNFEQEFSG